MSELIDRQDVIDRLKKAKNAFRANGAKLEANGIHYALELVESDIEIPTVDAYPFEQLQELVKLNQQFAQKIAELKRPQGKWIITSEDADGIHHIKCPFCKYEKGHEFEPHIKITFDKLPYFCEYCGADMREVQKGTKGYKRVQKGTKGYKTMLIKKFKSPFNARQKECIEICKRRSEAGMTCYYCIYRDTKTCEGIKQGYQVDKPKQIIFF